jgi:uncharacterized protein (TIGR04255 family)
MNAMRLDLPQADDRIAARRTVTMAICQVRYDQQASIGSGATALAFHERLGGAEGLYPKIEEAEGANRIVMGIGPGRPIAETTRINGWSLTSADDAWSLALLPGNMGLQSNSYKGWDDFAQRLTAALDALREVVGPAVEQRVGLRFVDLVAGAKFGVDSPVGWEPYINREFLGALLVPDLGRSIRICVQQALIDLGDDALCNLRTGPAGANEDGSIDFMIDCDLFREGGRSFDTAAILSTVSTFREQANRLLQSVVTPSLLDKLDT